MTLTIRCIATILFLSLTIPASAMPVSEFLPKADKLMNAGMGAMFSKHRKPVMAEMKKVTKGYRADIKAARAAGIKTSSCPPPKGKGKLNGKEFLAHLKTIPVAQRDIEVKTAFHGFMKKKYPC
ncbi:MAG: hypothetical protein ABJP02_08210 [Parasphingorhabdus sp.]|uniref:hypothetical protein n=1 Tax=Parasphingorhabdus sp. TaxID=2709688 RepID=UPI003296DFB1